MENARARVTGMLVKAGVVVGRDQAGVVTQQSPDPSEAGSASCSSSSSPYGNDCEAAGGDGGFDPQSHRSFTGGSKETGTHALSSKFSGTYTISGPFCRIKRLRSDDEKD